MRNCKLNSNKAIAKKLNKVMTNKALKESIPPKSAIAADLYHTQLLGELGARFVSEQDVQILYDQINAVARKLTHADAGTVQIFDEKTKELVLISTYGFPPDSVKRFGRVTASSVTSCGVALATGERTIINFDAPYQEDPKSDLFWHLQAGYVCAQSTPLIARSGKPIGMLSTHWRTHYHPSERELIFLDLLARQAADLIDHKMSEKSLRDQRLMYETIMSTTPDLIYIFDLNHRFIYANKSLLEMWGRSWEEAIGKNCLELGYEPWHAAMHDREIEQVIQTKKTIRGEVPFNGTNGRKIYDYIFVPVLGENGDVEAIAGTTRDITERKHMEEVLKQFASMVESSDDAIISKDLNSIITSWNKGAERIFGYKAQEVIGKSITILIPQDRQDEEPAILQRIIKGERIDHYDTIRKHKDGSLINISLTISPIRNESGIIGASKIARDITERVKAQEELKKFSLELEQRVVERTKTLEDQARRLRELAVQLTEAEQKERRRLAEVLHDHLQQYLVAARMRIEFMERKAGRDSLGLQDARSYIDKAFEASRQLTAELRPPVLHEGGLSAGLRYLSQKMQNQYQLRVYLSILDDAEPGTDVVKVMLYQCIQELLFNAVKYAKTFECFVSVRRLEGDKLQIKVEDKGQGFDVTQVGSKDKGGFGLFSIRERMKALGGDFAISSTPGQGSLFTLVVPDKVDAAVKEDNAGFWTQKVMSREKSKQEGITVLVADDHLIIRQSMASFLMAQPFIKEVIEAGNGEEALHKAETLDPDIILMDINMPVMNGLEATQLLCSKNFRAKVIGLSVHKESEMAQTMKEAGALAYFNKGDDTIRLIETIRALSGLSTPTMQS